MRIHFWSSVLSQFLGKPSFSTATAVIDSYGTWRMAARVRPLFRGPRALLRHGSVCRGLWILVSRTHSKLFRPSPLFIFDKGVILQTVTRLDEGFRKQYQHRCHRKMKAVAKVAAARRLAVRLYWMLRSNTAYPEIARIEGSPR